MSRIPRSIIIATAICGSFISSFGQQPPTNPPTPEDMELPAPPNVLWVKPEGGLPPGFFWKTHDGPDFFVYYGFPPKGNSSTVGVYVGLHPNFKVPLGAKAKEGMIAGVPVTWNVIKRGKHAFSATTLIRSFPAKTSSANDVPVSLHIWVNTKTESELLGLLSTLESLKLPLMRAIPGAP